MSNGLMNNDLMDNGLMNNDLMVTEGCLSTESYLANDLMSNGTASTKSYTAASTKSYMTVNEDSHLTVNEDSYMTVNEDSYMNINESLSVTNESLSVTNESLSVTNESLSVTNESLSVTNEPLLINEPLPVPNENYNPYWLSKENLINTSQCINKPLKTTNNSYDFPRYLEGLIKIQTLKYSPVSRISFVRPYVRSIGEEGLNEGGSAGEREGGRREGEGMREGERRKRESMREDETGAGTGKDVSERMASGKLNNGQLCCIKASCSKASCIKSACIKTACNLSSCNLSSCNLLAPVCNLSVPHNQMPSSHSLISSVCNLMPSSYNQMPSSHNYKMTLEGIKYDGRTTCMIKNIPNKYTTEMMLDFINASHFGEYNFFYLRMDFRNKCNVGYAFINFSGTNSIERFYKRINGKKWPLFCSGKIAELTYASIQGIESLKCKFRRSTVMLEHREYRPRMFYTEGECKGSEWENWGEC